jgi:O-antigen/teichoic acid export membrane protein
LVTIFSLIAISGILFYKGIDERMIHLYTNVAVIFIQLHELFRSILFANLHLYRVLIADIVACSTRIVGLILIVKLIGGVASISNLILAVAFSSLLGAITAYTISELKFRFVFDKVQIVRNFNFAKWLSLEALLGSLSFRAYILIVSIFIDEKSFAIFAACSVIAQILNLILSGLLNVATPVAAKKINQNEDIFKGFIKTLKLYGSVFIISLSVGTYALHQEIFRIVFNGKFENYENVLLILIMANIVFFYQYINVMVVKVYGRPDVISIARFLTAVFSLTAGVLLAKNYSIEGVSVSIALSALMTWLILKRCISRVILHEQIIS